MPTVERAASQGTYTNSTKPSTVFYAAAKAKLYASTAATRPAFLYTPIPAEVRGTTIISAELVLIADVDWPSTRTVTVQRHANPSPTTYSKMTFANRPGVLAGSTGVAVGPQAGTTRTWTFDVTDDVQAVADGGAFYGWRIITDDSNPRAFRGAEASAGAPVLSIEYETETADPSGLSPDGGAVSIAKPVFTWLAPDNLTQFRIEIDEESGDFSSPVFNSGLISSTIGQWDSSASAWTGISDGTTLDWRVTNVTPGGSAVSDTATFSRVNKSSLTIDNPGATSGDPTPPVEWTFGGTQTAFQVTRLRPTGATWEDSGRRGGTDDALTLSVGPTVDAGTATDRVRVWDDVDRVATPGDPTYIEDSQSWALDLDGGIAAVSDIDAAQVGESPRISVTWTRVAGTPDEWLVLRDAEQVARFDGPENGVGGTWAWVDWTAPPNREVTYTVRPIINGVSGDTGPEVAVTTEVKGAWLMDPLNGLWFRTDGTNIDMPLTETSTVYVPPTGLAVKRTNLMRGREGTVAGLLRDYERPLDDDVADLELMRLSSTSVYRLIWGTNNIPVIVANLTHDVSYEFSATRQRPHTASFSAWQCDEVTVAEP